MLLKILSIFVSLILFAGAGQMPEPYSPADSENLKCSAVILSDMHIETNNFDRFPRAGKILAGVANASVSPDVVGFTGDNTMNGQSIEWFDFYGFVNRYIKDSRILMCFGNHDFGNCADHDTYVKLRKRCIEKYKTYCGERIDEVYYSRDIKGCRFIVLGSEDNAENTVEVITDKQIRWLSDQLAECREKNMPVIVLNHNLIYGRNGSRSYWDFNQTTNNDALDHALQDSGATVLFVCGHSHFGVNEGSVSREGKVTYVNLPSTGNTGNYEAEGEYADCGVGIYIEVYEGRMILSFRNFAKDIALEGYDNIEISL